MDMPQPATHLFKKPSLPTPLKGAEIVSGKRHDKKKRDHKIPEKFRHKNYIRGVDKLKNLKLQSK